MKRILTAFLLVLLAGGCTDNFDAINENPNAPESVDAQFLLSNVLYTTANMNAFEGWENGNLLVQLTTKFDFNDVDRYDLRTNEEVWNSIYYSLRDLETVIAQAEERDNDTYKGIALVMRAYLAAYLTDLWGDVPFQQAVQGSQGNFTPTYDTQEAIYTGEGGILESLREAAQLLETATGTVSGDIIFQGDREAWLRFANSLQVRYLMRISGRVDVGADLATLVAGGRLFVSNEDNAVMPYLSTAPNQWYVYTVRSGDYNNVRMSEKIEAVLKGFDDPRLFTLFKPSAVSQNTSTPVYTGLESGLGPSSRTGILLNEVSTLGSLFRDVPDGVSAMLMTYAELQFTLAEAVARNIIPGDARTYYEAGIAASFEYYEVPMPADYLQRPGVAYDPVNGIELIITQKWLANFMNGYEPWFDYRRTGFPTLEIVRDNLNNGVYPVRYKYPFSEQAVNKANYDATIARIGEDSHNIPGWWEE